MRDSTATVVAELPVDQRDQRVDPQSHSLNDARVELIVLGQRVAPLGVEKFGQTGNLSELYATYRLDGDAIAEAVAELLLPA